MQALHKLAGVQEASDPGAQPAAPVRINKELPPPPPIPQDDAVDIDAHSTRSSARRASVPISRRASKKSTKSHRSKRSVASRRSTSREAPPTVDLSSYPPSPRPNQELFGAIPGSSGVIPGTSGSHIEGEEDDEEEEEFTWGPSHPCFPHPNPHCASDSTERATTRVIRVKRDWLVAGDLYPQYANLYPEILDPMVSDGDFRNLIGTINRILAKAFSPNTTRAWLDSILGVATGYIWEDLGWTGAKKGEKELERFLDKWNDERARDDSGVKVIQLRKTGFMNLDFVIPDPGIDQARSLEDNESEAAGDEQDLVDALREGGTRPVD